MNIEKLPAKFEGIGEVKGYNFERAEETDLGYIYKVTGDQRPHFEVFRKRFSAVCLDFATREYSTTDYKETYPRAKSFGTWAWSASNIEMARNRLYSLTDTQEA